MILGLDCGERLMVRNRKEGWFEDAWCGVVMLKEEVC